MNGLEGAVRTLPPTPLQVPINHPNYYILSEHVLIATHSKSYGRPEQSETRKENR